MNNPSRVRTLSGIKYVVLPLSEIRDHVLSIAAKEWDPQDFGELGDDLQKAVWSLEVIQVRHIKELGRLMRSKSFLRELRPRIESASKLIVRGRAIPPLILRGSDYLVFDGYARLYALRARGLAECLAYVGRIPPALAMGASEIGTLTPHKDVNAILAIFAYGLPKILGSQLNGLYLTGSLTYGGFDPGSSDVDFLAVLNRELSASQRLGIQKLHSGIASRYPEWAKRIEGSYITKDMLDSVEPPRRPRPYINAGKFWDPDPRYGNEWLLNLFVLREAGVALIGPDPKDMIPPVAVDDVREASKRDLHAEWAPKLREPAPFDKSGYDSSHLQAYAILTICRILYRTRHDDVASKRVAAHWVKKTYGRPWKSLVEKAENWHHGQELDEEEKTLKFIEFALEKVG